MLPRRASDFRLSLLVLLLALAWSSLPSAAQRPGDWSATLAAPMKTFEKKGNRQQAIRNYAKALSMMDPDPAGSSYQALKRLLSEKQ